MISVVVTTYKRSPEMVRRAINSVLSQTHEKFELIIVDDSPSDYSERRNVENLILGLHDDRVKYIQHEENRGACAARNTGIGLSKGDYIAFLDDDDEWLPNKLEYQLKEFVDSKIGLVYCDHYLINSKTNEKSEIKHIEPRDFSNIIVDLLTWNFIGSTSFPLIRKECFIECEGFDETLQSSQDLEMWLRIASKYKVSKVATPLVNYYIHSGEQITSNPAKKIQATNELNNRYYKFLLINKNLYNFRLIRLSSYYSKAGALKKALIIWAKAVKINPYKGYRNIKGLLKIGIYFLTAFVNRNK